MCYLHVLFVQSNDFQSVDCSHGTLYSVGGLWSVGAEIKAEEGRDL